MKIPKKILLGTPIALISLQIYFGIIFGYFLAKFLSGKESGYPGKLKSFAFDIGNYKLHLHHWLYGLVILISAWYYNFLPFPQFSFAFLGGTVFQGIVSYRDWYKILMRINY